MSEIDWPRGWERTAPADRERTTKFGATLAETCQAIATEMSRMGVDDYHASTGSGGSHVRENGLPKHSANPDDPGFVLQWSDDGEQFAVACDHYASLRDNARSVYLWVHETRMRSNRPVVTGDAEFAAARLPSGDEEEAVVAEEPPHEVLGVDRDASEAEIQEAFREKAKETHSDAGGSSESFMRVKDARDALLGGEE